MSDELEPTSKKERSWNRMAEGITNKLENLHSTLDAKLQLLSQKIENQEYKFLELKAELQKTSNEEADRVKRTEYLRSASKIQL